MYWYYIRQHVQCRDGGGWLQWKTAASVLQSGNWAHWTVEAKVRTIQKTMIPIRSRVNAPARRKRPWHFPSIHFLLANYSSLGAVAHERWGVCKWYNHRTARICPAAFLCTLEITAMQSVYDDYPASSYAAYRWDAICNDVVSYKWPSISEHGRLGDCCSSRQRSRIVGRLLCGTIWNR